MKNLFLIAVLVVTSLTLFSFRSVEDNSNQGKVEAVSLTKGVTSFTEYYHVFPSHFTEYRRVFSETSFSENTSLDEVNATLEKF